MIFLYAIIGIMVGGLINQLADLLRKRHSKWQGFVCPSCSQPRSFSQSLALLTLITGQRICPKCSRPVAVRNLIVEVSVAALFALLFTHYSDPIVLILASFHTSVLVLVTVTDFEHRLIPNRAILPAIAAAAITSPLWFGPGWYLALVGGVIGYVFFWLAAVVGGKAFGRGALGYGDVKLAAYVGLITGFPGVIAALVLTILAGGVISTILLLIRVVNMRSGIPYGPFLVLGGFTAMVWGQQLVNGFFFGR